MKAEVCPGLGLRAGGWQHHIWPAEANHMSVAGGVSHSYCMQAGTYASVNLCNGGATSTHLRLRAAAHVGWSCAGPQVLEQPGVLQQVCQRGALFWVTHKC